MTKAVMKHQTCSNSVHILCYLFGQILADREINCLHLKTKFQILHSMQIN